MIFRHLLRLPEIVARTIQEQFLEVMSYAERKARCDCCTAGFSGHPSLGFFQGRLRRCDDSRFRFWLRQRLKLVFLAERSTKHQRRDVRKPAAGFVNRVIGLVWLEKKGQALGSFGGSTPAVSTPIFRFTSYCSPFSRSTVILHDQYCIIPAFCHSSGRL